jgi:hypothetical protein
MPILSEKFIADFRRDHAAEHYQHQMVMAQRRRLGAEDAALAAALTPSANIILGALLRELRPRLVTDARLNLAPVLHGVNARNLPQHKARIIADINKQCGHKLQGDVDRLSPLLEALSLERSLMAADDACAPNKQQAYRQANYLARPTASDTEEWVPGEVGRNPNERGTSAMTPAPMVEDDIGLTDEGVRNVNLSPGNLGTNKTGREARGRVSAGAQDYYAAAKDAFGELLGGGETDHVKLAKLCAMLKAEGFADADCRDSASTRRRNGRVPDSPTRW